MQLAAERVLVLAAQRERLRVLNLCQCHRDRGRGYRLRGRQLMRGQEAVLYGGGQVLMVVVVECGIAFAFSTEKGRVVEGAHGIEPEAALIVWALPIFGASLVEEADDREIVIEVLRDGVVVDLTGGLVVNEQSQTAQALDVDGVDISDGVGGRRVFEQIEDLRLQR